MNDQGADFIYTGQQPVPFMLPNGLKEILDYDQWLAHSEKQNKFPLLTPGQWNEAENNIQSPISFIKGNIHSFNQSFLEKIRGNQQVVLVVSTDNAHAMPELRRFFYTLTELKIKVPVIIQRTYQADMGDRLTLYSATDIGGLLVDGFGDGTLLSPEFSGEATHTERLKAASAFNSIAFGILQAARTRMSKTEYISCPSCGRTLFDLQETTAMIRKHTEHLKGVKIGIMGCIVNGPGEMADADYGYVGMGKDKIALYRGQEVIKRSVTAAKAVDELIELIREDGRWIEPEEREVLV
jgi:(E)-4-hydroxy-3-methylbut-2-enyl-diphosphate synthase